MNNDNILKFSDAVVFGDFDIVKSMVEENAEIINSQDKYGYTALHNVMSEEEFEIVEYLIKNGADVNIQNEDGVTPLHLAAYTENANILLDNGAEINQQDNRGNTPLHAAVIAGEEHREMIKFLIDNGADASIINQEGKTPLDFAS